MIIKSQLVLGRQLFSASAVFLFLLLCQPVDAQSRVNQGRLEVNNFYIEGDGFDLNNDRQVSLTALLKRAEQMRAALGETATVDELHQIADSLTLYIRDLGFRFDTVYLPPQEIFDGVVRLHYKKAQLVDIHIINQSTIEDSVIKAPFKKFIGEALYVPTIDEKVYALRAQTGIKVFAYFSRAGRNGEVRLNLKVEDLPRLHYSLRADNFGSVNIGEYRLTGEIGTARIFSTFDSVLLSVTQTLDALKTRHAHLRYSYPFASMNSAIKFSIGNGAFAIGDSFESLDIDGDTFSTTLDFHHTLRHKRDFESWFTSGVYHRASDTQSGFDSTLDSTENSQALSLSYGLNRQFSAAQTRMRTLLHTQLGQFSGSRFENSQALTKIGANLSTSSLFFSDKRLAAQLSIGLRGQYAGAALPAIESMVLGGNHAVRAYPSGKFSSDNAFITNTNVYFPFAFKNWNSDILSIIPYFFYDYAKGEKYVLEDLPTKRITAQGFGTGLRFRYYQFSGGFLWATPIAIGSGITDSKGSQWLFELRWR